ncbi:MAG TPA: FAD-dependent oxidoreductase [Burkholderiaceae bacterium]|nr:FAD-dependent oxidoreductase [Burkholderiaceae bacterium]
MEPHGTDPLSKPEPGRLSENFRIAIVGAGISGLACARALVDRGARVTVFEQGRRPGGRAATLRTEFGNFDHGAHYFTVHNHTFERAVAQWLQAGVATRWPGRIIAIEGAVTEDKTASAIRYTGAAGMISIAKHLSEGLDVRLDTRIGAVLQTGLRWVLLDETERAPSPGGFDALVLAMPSGQAAQLAGVPPALVQHLRMVEWRPSWAAVLALQAASGFDFAGAFVNDHPALSWVAREDGESGSERWVLHASADWTVRHLNMPSDDVASLLAQALAERFNFGFRPAYVSAHLWLYATPVRPLLERYLWDAKLRIGAIGDWCQGPRLEGAFLSGDSLGAAITS